MQWPLGLQAPSNGVPKTRRGATPLGHTPASHPTLGSIFNVLIDPLELKLLSQLSQAGQPLTDSHVWFREFGGLRARISAVKPCAARIQERTPCEIHRGPTNQEQKFLLLGKK